MQQNWKHTWLPILPYVGLAMAAILWAISFFPATVLGEALLFLAAGLTLVRSRIRVTVGYLLPASVSVAEASVLVLPPAAAVLINAFLGLALSISGKRSADRTVFNIANYVVPTLAAALVYQWLNPLWSEAAGVPGTMAAAVIAILIRFGMNIFHLHLKVALEEQRPPLKGLWKSFRSEIWAKVVFRMAAITVMMAYPFSGPWILLPVVLLLLSLNQVIQVYTQREVLVRAARMDGLTGVGNRRAWEERVREFGTRRLEAGLLFVVDLDGLKRLNDSAGHMEGDRAICAVAQRLAAAAGSTDCVYRYGGDEFVVFLPAGTQDSPAANRIQQSIRAFGQTTSIGGLPISASLGMAAAPADGTSLSQLFVAADQRMYAAKGRQIQVVVS